MLGLFNWVTFHMLRRLSRGGTRSQLNLCCINRYLRHPLHRVKVCDIAYYGFASSINSTYRSGLAVSSSRQVYGIWVCAYKLVIVRASCVSFSRRRTNIFSSRRHTNKIHFIDVLLQWMQQGAQAETTVTLRGVVAGDPQTAVTFSVLSTFHCLSL